MRIQFTRTPPAEYAAYVEGEAVDLPEQEARYLVGLGVAAYPRNEAAMTQNASSRTEIVGADNRTEVVVTGRGSNIKTISDPENDKLPAPIGGGTSTAITEDARLAASKSHATELVKQEAGRTGGFIDQTKPIDLGAKLTGDGQSLDHESGATDAELKEQEAAAKKSADASGKKDATGEKPATPAKEDGKKSSGSAPENK